MNAKIDLKTASSPQDPTSFVINIRTMDEKDLERVHEIDQQSFSLPWPGRAFRYELKENPNALLWVAEATSVECDLLADDEVMDQYSSSTVAHADSSSYLPRNEESQNRLVVGMIVVWMILDEAHIATLAVDPQYRGTGIAGRLLDTALQTAVQRNANQVTLEVRAGNQAAIALYRRYNFQVIGNRPRYYKDNNEDALIMTLNLRNKIIE